MAKPERIIGYRDDKGEIKPGFQRAELTLGPDAQRAEIPPIDLPSLADDGDEQTLVIPSPVRPVTPRARQRGDVLPPGTQVPPEVTAFLRAQQAQKNPAENPVRFDGRRDVPTQYDGRADAKTMMIDLNRVRAAPEGQAFGSGGGTAIIDRNKISGVPRTSAQTGLWGRFKKLLSGAK
jgi:hypothetical protein